jgi:amyloid beta precursor protein binding protein 1
VIPQFSLVVVSNSVQEVTLAIAKGDATSIILSPNAEDYPLVVCWTARVPLVVIRSIGFLCTYRVQLREHEIIEPKIDKSNKGLDLCVSRAFPGLRRFCDQLDLDTLDFTAHSHVPYIVILYKCIQEWRTLHDGDPRSFADKEMFRALIRSKARDLTIELNFQEAIEKSYQGFAWESVSDEILELIIRTKVYLKLL